MKQRTLLLWAACGLLFASALAPQSPMPASSATSRLRASGPATPRSIRVSSDLVLVPVLVMDETERLITGLDRARFKLYDDGAVQEISHFATEDVPVSVVVVFDTSGSMGRKLQMSRLAVNEFVKASNPEDEFALIEFSNRVQLVTPFTVDPGDILGRVSFTDSRGRTALIDAVYAAVELTKKASHSRKAILVISDGGDNCSRYNNSELKQRVREADVQIYSIGILDSLARLEGAPEEISGPSLLNEIAGLTGGKLFEVESLGALPDIAKRIGSALRNQYVLGYSPSAPKRDDRYHRITVKLDQPKGQPKLRATFRSKYFSPSQ